MFGTRAKVLVGFEDYCEGPRVQGRGWKGAYENFIPKGWNNVTTRYSLNGIVEKSILSMIFLPPNVCFIVFAG